MEPHNPRNNKKVKKNTHIYCREENKNTHKQNKHTGAGGAKFNQEKKQEEQQQGSEGGQVNGEAATTLPPNRTTPILTSPTKKGVTGTTTPLTPTRGGIVMVVPKELQNHLRPGNRDKAATGSEVEVFAGRVTRSARRNLGDELAGGSARSTEQGSEEQGSEEQEGGGARGAEQPSK